MVKVTSPLGQYVLVDKVCKNCHLMIWGCNFPIGLVLLPFDEFDMILDMDWLTLHYAVVNCKRKIIVLKCQNCKKVQIESDRLDSMSNAMSAMSGQKYVRKGCEAYLAYIFDYRVFELKLESIQWYVSIQMCFQRSYPCYHRSERLSLLLS